MKRQCDEDVTIDGFNFHRCGNTAKYVVVFAGKIQYYCGVHSRTFRKYMPQCVSELIAPERDATAARGNQTGADVS